MARPMQQIKKDLAALEEKATNLAVELHDLYSKYLNLLSQSVRKQLILASYQICTQAYPESFLKLSLSERQSLQNKLRQLGKKIQSQLLVLLEIPVQSQDFSDAGKSEGKMLGRSSSAAELSQKINLEPQKNPKITNPEDLVQWCKQVETSLHKTLEIASQEANSYFQETQILPAQVPAKVLEMAMQAEGSGTPISGSPNLLNLLVESDRDLDEESEVTQESSKIAKLIAIHLRLSEIEFSDPTLSIERNRLQSCLEKLRKIWQQDRQIQREYATAEAESAWRASWYED